MYVTATSPYIFMLILLIRSAFLTGAREGVEFYLEPKLDLINDMTVWQKGIIKILMIFQNDFWVLFSNKWLYTFLYTLSCRHIWTMTSVETPLWRRLFGDVSLETPLWRRLIGDVHRVISVWPTTRSRKLYLEDFLVILKQTLQNYYKIIMKYCLYAI